MNSLSGNKGEWSEIYVFLRLLAEKKLYAGDGNLKKMEDTFYRIIHIVRTEPGGSFEFRINEQEDKILVINLEDNSIINSLSCSQFDKAADILYDEIIQSKAPSFTVPNTELFLRELNIETLKAKSSNKADIKIKIHDINTGYEAIQGFSIKSRLGHPSTLVNAGKTTNFIYEIVGDITDEVMNQCNASKKFRDKFSILNAHGCTLKFDCMESDTFENNLQLIDGDLPRICAYLLKLYYSTGIGPIKDLLSSLSEENPIKYNLSRGHPFYEYKFKKYLIECALGMTPSKVWDGTADATGGYIIVREDGEVVCFHVFDRNEFESYLLNNTKFETASTTRHDFGQIYKGDNRYFLKLNLQIRFLK